VLKKEIPILSSYIEVLDAERSLFNAELSQAQTKGVLFQALVNLYKTMGGGWIVGADRMTDITKDSNGSTRGPKVFQEMAGGKEKPKNVE
jgi:multidrug efflux system outer membrane protein